jgi:hypothetical protein
MNRFRGILMVLAAIVAFWRGWTLHAGKMALIAYGLGVAALALGAWHLTQRPNERRRLKRGRM